MYNFLSIRCATEANSGIAQKSSIIVKRKHYRNPMPVYYETFVSQKKTA
jgi:hypothetical protein